MNTLSTGGRIKRLQEQSAEIAAAMGSQPTPK